MYFLPILKKKRYAIGSFRFPISNTKQSTTSFPEECRGKYRLI